MMSKITRVSKIVAETGEVVTQTQPKIVEELPIDLNQRPMADVVTDTVLHQNPVLKGKVPLSRDVEIKTMDPQETGNVVKEPFVAFETGDFVCQLLNDLKMTAEIPSRFA